MTPWETLEYRGKVLWDSWEPSKSGICIGEKWFASWQSVSYDEQMTAKAPDYIYKSYDRRMYTIILPL